MITDGLIIVMCIAVMYIVFTCTAFWIIYFDNKRKQKIKGDEK